jgi:hypothetical protein
MNNDHGLSTFFVDNFVDAFVRFALKLRIVSIILRLRKN